MEGKSNPLNQFSNFIDTVKKLIPNKYKFLVLPITIVGIIVYKFNVFIDMLSRYPFGLVFLFLLSGIWIFLKISDKISNEKLEEARDNEHAPISRESSELNNILFRLSEKFEKTLFLQLKIVNKGKRKVTKFDGRLQIFSQGRDTWREKIIDTQISLKNIELEGRSEYRIGQYRTSRGNEFSFNEWNYFKVIIDTIEFEDGTSYSTKVLNSNEFIRTHFFLLNLSHYFNDKIELRKIVIPIPTPYNTIWLNEKISKFIAKIIFLCSYHYYIFGGDEISDEEFKKARKDTLQCWLHRLFFAFLAILISFVLIISLYQFFQMIYCIIFMLGSYIWNKILK